MERQLSFKIEHRAPGATRNQQQVKRARQSRKSAQKSKRLDTTRKQSQLDTSKQALKETPLEQRVSELLTSLEKNLKLKSLSLEEEDREKQLSGIHSLKENSLRTQFQKKEQLFDNLISVKTVAEGLGVAPKTIHNWIYLRKIPYVKCGQKVMFRPKSLKAWLTRKEVKSWL